MTCWDFKRRHILQAHPDARSYKTKAVLNFSDLCLIYGYTNADGRYSRSSHDIDFDDEAQAVNTGKKNLYYGLVFNPCRIHNMSNGSLFPASSVVGRVNFPIISTYPVTLILNFQVMALAALHLLIV